MRRLLLLGHSDFREKGLRIAVTAIDAVIVACVADEPFVIERLVDPGVLRVSCQRVSVHEYKHVRVYIPVGRWASSSGSWSVEPGVGDREMRRAFLVLPRRLLFGRGPGLGSVFEGGAGLGWERDCPSGLSLRDC